MSPLVLVIEKIEAAYWCNVGEQLCKIADHAINIFIPVHEAMALGVSNLSNDIESKVLQPLGEVTDFARPSVDPIGLGQEQIDDLVNEWLVLHKSTHRKGVVDGPSEIGMVRLVCR